MMLRLMFIVVGVVFGPIVTNTYGEQNCSESELQAVRDTDYVHCNEIFQQKVAVDNEAIMADLNKICCLLSDTITCWTETMRSKCGDIAANDVIRTAEFKFKCSSWKYPESISWCESGGRPKKNWFTESRMFIILLIAVAMTVSVFVVVRMRRRARI